MKQAFSTPITVLITIVITAVLTGVITYTYTASVKDMEMAKTQEALSDNITANENENKEDGIAWVEDEKDDMDINNWETFKDLKYGFSFKYPGEWRLRETNEDDAKKLEAEWIFATHIEDESGSIQVNVYDQKWLDADLISIANIKSRLMNVNGAKENELTIEEINNHQTLRWLGGYYFPGTEYVIYYSESSGKMTKEGFWPFYNQILSTFEFTE